jgi:probable HAF family extracellular repeat protein
VGGIGSEARDVSADGLVVVGFSSTASGYQAFRWTQQIGMSALGDLPGGRVASTANAVSADGSVIVGDGETFYQDGVAPRSEAFFWTAQTGMLNLRDLLVTYGANNLDGWRLDVATGLASDGMTIVGYGTNPSGNTEAWVATIPEPSTLLLAALAALVLLALYVRASLGGAGRIGYPSCIHTAGMDHGRWR